MNVIDIAHKFGYDQWIVKFTSNVLDAAHISGNKAIVYYVESKWVYVSVDGQIYAIHMTDFIPTKKDRKSMICREEIVYTLYINDGHSDTKPMKEISSGSVTIEWDNDPMFFKSEFSHLNFYEQSKDLADIQIGDDLTLYVETVNNHSFSFEIKLDCYTAEERDFITDFYGKHQNKPLKVSNNSLQLIQLIDRSSIQNMIDRCFDVNEFDLNYTRWLLRCCYSNKLCSRKRMIEEENTLIRLYDCHKKGDASAMDSIRDSLTEFIRATKPYYAIICAD